MSQKKKDKDIINGDLINGEPPVDGDLINAGTTDYIELRSPVGGNIFVTYHDHLDDSPYAGANIYPSYTNPTFNTVVPYFLQMWLDAGRLTQIQYNNAIAQLNNLGY